MGRASGRNRQAAFPSPRLRFSLVITDLTEDLAAEQKARTTYDNILRLVDDPDVREPIRFLRAREIVHFQRFGEALENAKRRLDSKNLYAYNPEVEK